MRWTWRMFTKMLAGAALLSTCPMGMAQGLPYPISPLRPVTDTYPGVTVSDPFRWLEDTRSAEVQKWVAAQNALTRSVIDKLPQRAAIAAELADLLGKAPVTRRGLQFAGGRLFALKRQPPANQARLVVLSDPMDVATEKVVLDPLVLNAKGTTTIDWYVPSLDGRKVAVSLSDNGSEDGTLHFYDVASGRKLPDVVPRVQYPTAGGSAAWAAGNGGVYYTRFPQGKERAPADANFYQQVWFHRLGTPASKDRYVAGKDFPRIAEIALSTTEDGRYLLADVANGDGGEHAFHLRDPAGKWTRIAGFDDGVRSIALGRDGRWYGLVLKASPRGRIVSGALKSPALSGARPVLAQAAQVIAGFTPTRHRLYVEYLAGGPQELHTFTLEGRALGRIGNEAVATAYVGTALKDDTILYGSQSFVQPFAWYRYAPTSKSPTPPPVKTALDEERRDLQLGDAEVRREFATSKDGTKVPLNIVMPRGTPLDGTSPVLLTGYGGYGVSMQPYFSPLNVFWLRHGGIFVVANLRGGGEFGEDWHLAGNLTRKQNVFDDFIASAEYLQAKRYTSSRRLAIEGASNGGLLMGAVMVQRPELFKAVVSQVGLYDMLRVELSPNGEFNTTEFGSVKDPAQFKALYAYSPYHHVVEGADYPAVMLLTGMNDGRVEPHNSFKMAARLQDAMPKRAPVLLRVAGDAGHGMGTALSSRIAQEADIFTFLFDQLRMK